MSMIDIDGALIAGYKAIGLGLVTGYENKNFTPPSPGGDDWAALFQLPVGTNVETSFERGWDKEEGILQIDFNTEPGTGRAGLIAYAQAVRDQFVAGKQFTRNSQSVRIIKVDRSAVREIDGYTRISVSINWSSMTIRPAI
jgi:hypothetical protein